MAFSGLHVVAAYAGSYVAAKSKPILGKIIWSEDPASGVTTTNSAPADSDSQGQPVFRIRAAADSWVAVGKSPNPTSGTRFLAPANTDVDVYAEAGDRVQWISA